MKKILCCILLLASCRTADYTQVHIEHVRYVGYERRVRADGYIYFLKWQDIRGGSEFWSRSDSMPNLIKGTTVNAFLNF